MSQRELSRRVAQGRWSGDSELPPLLRRLYELRGVTCAEDADLSLNRLVHYRDMPGIDDAVAVLTRALQRQSRVLIVGDYDADGTVGAVVLHKALQMLGYRHIDYTVPDRFRFGYGLSPRLVQVAMDEKQPDLIITVDNGVASVDGVALAKQHDVEVVITDHHLPGTVLPDASAIVNPNLPDSKFAAPELAGVGVALYLMLALRQRLHDDGVLDKSSAKLSVLLDLVAVGTAADVVPLNQNNRILIQQGLQRIRSGRGTPGIRALLQVAKRDPQRAVSADLSFAVGPRLNAAGRLHDTSLGLACLLAEDEKTAYSLAVKLNEINIQRRQMQQQMQETAMKYVAAVPDRDVPAAFCLFDDSWHEGLVGLIAARLKDRFYRPVVAFARGDEGVVKGSARSIPEVHIRDLLERIAIDNDGLIAAFGGHAMAAGVSLSEADFPRFKELFEREAQSLLKGAVLENKLLSDGELAADEISYDTAEMLSTSSPWGKDFPEPLFDGVFEVVDKELINDKHLKLICSPVSDSEAAHKAMFFNFTAAFSATAGCDFDAIKDKIRIAYHLETDDFRGQRAPLLNIQHIEPIDND